jgi:hypothetical protein
MRYAQPVISKVHVACRAGADAMMAGSSPPLGQETLHLSMRMGQDHAGSG